jgi:hypothetical protein
MTKVLTGVDFLAGEQTHTAYQARRDSGAAPNELIEERAFDSIVGPVEGLDILDLRVEARQRYFKSRTSSRFRGVSWSSNRKMWHAAIRYQNLQITTGYFADELAAARAYDRKSRELRGDRAWLNLHSKTGAELLAKRIGLVDGKDSSARARRLRRSR